MRTNPTTNPGANPTDTQMAALRGAARADGLTAGYKYLSLKSGAIDGNTMTGDASGIGNLDSYNDVIFPGAFSAEVILDFLQSGFIADGHDWTRIVAMPKVAEVRGSVLYTECLFHSTDDAQALKTKCQERIENDLSVGLSIGFGMYGVDCKSFPNGKALLAYAKSEGFDLSLFDEEGIAACTTRCQAILKIAKLYEYSPVPVPANPIAWATAMKAAGMQDNSADAAITAITAITADALVLCAKGQYLGDYVEASMTMAALARLTDALYYNIFWDAIYYSSQPKADRRELLAGGLAEYAGYALRAFDALISDDDDGADAEDADDDILEALSAIKTFWPKPEGADADNPAILSLRAGERFATTLETARAAVARVIERARGIQAVRLKEGRQLSQSNRDTLTAHRDALSDCVSTINDLLAATDTTDTTTEEDAEKSATVLGLLARQLQRRIEERELLGIEDLT